MEAQLAQQRAEQRIAVAISENADLRRQLAELDARRQAAEAGLVEAQAALTALERVEEQLWEAKGQLLLERERAAAPAVPRATAEGSLPPASVSEGAHRAVVEAVVRELGGLEAALRAESAEVAALEQRLGGAASDAGA
jgi:hypothetical protein